MRRDGVNPVPHGYEIRAIGSVERRDDGVELDAPPTFQMRRCTARDAPSLTRVAHASKASWGYPDELLALWDADLTLDPAFVERHDVWSAVAGDEVVGVYAVTGDGSTCEIEHLWVDPGWMGRGVGRRMLEHLVARARATGVEELRVASDPNAAGLPADGRPPGGRAGIRPGRSSPRLPTCSTSTVCAAGLLPLGGRGWRSTSAGSSRSTAVSTSTGSAVAHAS